MSKKRQSLLAEENRAEEGILVRTFAVRHFRSPGIGAHVHDWHQLIYAGEGVMWVQTAQGEWVVPPTRAVWVPAGIEHSIDLSSKVFVQTLYLSADLSNSLPSQCAAVNISPLLRELVFHIIKLGTLDRLIPHQARTIDFLLDQLQALATIPLQLPLPADERARKAAEWMRAHPDDLGSLKQLAKQVSASVRTLERLFQRETGMTFGKWRQQLRLLHALRLLAEGKAVTAVALEVGYESPSAFIAAFKRFFGATPSRYFA